MNLRIIRNNLVKQKAITLTTMFFVAAAAMLVALASILIVNLSGAIDTLLERSKTPHFMQMHAGELNSVRLEAFVEEHDMIAASQVVEFLNIDSENIILGKRSLAGNVQDNGFSVQNRNFDYLLDLEGEIIQVAPGEVYVPICYMKEGLVQVGNIVQVFGVELTVAGALRDSQMNSLLSSSKRFLVSADDFASLKNFGSVEYLIEFRLRDLTDLGAFEAAYSTAGLEANGPTITYPLFKILNGLSDGLMIAVLLLISALVVIVAFLCIRFTLLAKIEDDYREIGVMKAIGMRVSDIKKFYLLTYALIAGAGCILGFGLSFAFKGILLENIRLAMGESENSALAPILAIVSVSFVFFLIVGYVNRVLHRFRKISAVESIRYGIAQDRYGGAKQFRLSKIRLLKTNIFLGIKDVLTRKRIYITMLVVLVLAVFIIIVPQNLYNTVSSENFISYMGLGLSDLRIDIQQTESIAEKAAAISEVMRQDETIDKHVVLTTRVYNVKLDNGSEERLKIELGDHTVFPLSYSKGKAPNSEDEIALSVIQAGDMEKKVGDTIIVIIGEQERILTVSGIYSDVTNGGKTAKAMFHDMSAAVMWSVISASLRDKTLIDIKAAEYSDQFAYAKVSDIEEFLLQTHGSTINAVRRASYGAIGVALAITVLISLLFMRMLISKDRYAIAVKKVLGFTNIDIRLQYIARTGSILVVGITIGTILSNTLGQAITGAVIATFGVSSFSFVINPIQAYVLAPLLMFITVFSVTLMATWNAGVISIAENIKE
jgi:putative ABC transport system permease protein